MLNYKIHGKWYIYLQLGIYLPTIWYIYLHLVDIYGKGIGKVIQQDPFRDFQSHLRLEKRPKTSQNDEKTTPRLEGNNKSYPIASMDSLRIQVCPKKGIRD